jgi:Nickel responsive protein SCO4226-like
MPLYMDVHRKVEGLTAQAVAGAHEQDLKVQDQYGVTYHKYWFNEETGQVFCLVEAPDKEAANRVHREAHGLVADELVEVQEGA